MFISGSLTTRSKKLLGAPGRTTSSKKLLGTRILRHLGSTPFRVGEEHSGVSTVLYIDGDFVIRARLRGRTSLWRPPATGARTKSAVPVHTAQ